MSLFTEFLNRKRKIKCCPIWQKTKIPLSLFQFSDFALEEWIRPIAQKLAEEFGACLFVEAWVADPAQSEDIKVHVAQKDLLPLAEYLLRNIKLEAPEIQSTLAKDMNIPQPPGFLSLILKKSSKISKSFCWVFLLNKITWITASKFCLF